MVEIYERSECVRNRSPRSVLVCLVVLCVLLLTAVIVLCVLIYTNNHQFHINYKNITQDRDQLLTKYTKLTEDRDQLTQQMNRMWRILNETGIELNYTENTKNVHLSKKHNGMAELFVCTDGSIYYQSSFYYISSEHKSWSESRKNFRARGADLIIINNKEEQDFIKNSIKDRLWIGLSDSDEDSTWKWVDKSTLTFDFWKSGEPNGKTKENYINSNGMFKKTFGDRNFSGTPAIDTEDGEEMNIYANADEINSHDVCRATEDTRRNQTFQHTGSECVRNRRLRSVLVCLVVLCVLLLTAVIVLCVLIYTNNHQFHINYKNITQDRDQLLTKYTKLTEERNELLTNNIKLTEEKDQLLNKYTKLTEERDQMHFKYINMIKEKDGLLSNNDNLNKQKEQLTQQINKLQRILSEKDGWIYYQSSFYFISSEKKSWSESRRYCREREADLTIINNRNEQDFVKKYSGSENHPIWIGLTDSEMEGRWKWVDGSTPTSSFWGSLEPNGQRRENCVITDSSAWADYPCNDAFKWICEKNINK
ncbi:uncharacterized protein LOC130546432 [Triplophysa rosa]|uniref:uncharacterized protein LOC130546432 n=1 Tax=Triplophysa rosa TaxID=992332 RepID=UPI002545D64C|nr:uncharacterized protein LOC130546432 [Triplophysa rosa]